MLFQVITATARTAFPLKFCLWQAAAERFYKSSREFKAIAGLCWLDLGVAM